jgi:hypothetical protein
VQGWISSVVAQGNGSAGVYLTFRHGPIPDRIYAALESDRQAIDNELRYPVKWVRTEKWQSVQIWRQFGDGMLTRQRAEVLQWLGEVTNRFVTTFRPRILSLLRDQRNAL